jgi:hypothetical protein
MILQSAQNLRWANAEGTAIDMTITWDRYPDPLPFTASQNDPEEHGRAIFAAAVAGAYGAIAPYEPPSPVAPAVPRSISRQQFFRMLARTPFATPAEALDAARTGSIPPALEPMFAALPEPQQTDARIMWATAVDFYRSDPLFALAVSMETITDAQLDQWFTEAATYGAVSAP